MRKQIMPNTPRLMSCHSCLRLGLLLDLSSSLDALQYVLTVLVELQLGDDDLRGVDADGD